MSCAEMYRQEQLADLELQNLQFEQLYRGQKGPAPGCFNLDPAAYYRKPDVGCAAPITDAAMGAWKAPSASGWKCNTTHQKRLKNQSGGGKHKRKKYSNKHRAEQKAATSGYYLDLNHSIGKRPVHRAYDNKLDHPSLKPIKHLANYSFQCKQPNWSETCL